MNSLAPVDKVTIRDAAICDLEQMRAIYNSYVSGSTATFALSEETPDDRRLWFETHRKLGYPVIVLENQDGIVGWGSLSAYSSRCGYKSTAEISVYLEQNHHGRGHGKLLTEELLQRAVKLKMHALLAFVCSENERSLALLKSRGFEQAGVLKEVGQKFGRWLDVIILQMVMR